MILRPLCPRIDEAQLARFEASFCTNSIYRVNVEGISIAIREEKLDVPLSKTYAIDDIRHDLNEANFSVAVEVDGTIVGFATAKYEAWNRRVILTGIYVLSEKRNQNIGSKLTDAVCDYGKNISARCVWVETQNINYPAIQFYLKIGFHFCGLDTTLYDDRQTHSQEIAFCFCRFL